MASVNNEMTTLNPSSLINIFNNALNAEPTRKVFKIKGVYLEGRGVPYRRYYYDALKDGYTDACITLVVPALFKKFFKKI